MIFSIADQLDKAETISPETFVGLNIWERRHIQEWVRGNPDILGEELLIVSMEFDRFVNSSDRLDLLALDRLGNLVVVEFKRDSASDYADLQALRYAAMISSMTIAMLVPYYRAYLDKYRDEHVVADEAEQRIIKFIDGGESLNLSNKPRIILCSEGFSQEITTTVLWLRGWGLNIKCVKLTPYKVGERIIIVPKIVIPLEEAQQYLTDIRMKEEEREQAVRGPYRQKTLSILLENGLIQPGQIVYLKNVPPYVEYVEGDPKFHATITGKQGRDAIRWMKDDAEYSLSALAWSIFKDSHPDHKDPGSLNGSVHWVNSEGRSLWQIAEEFLAKTTPD